MDTRRRILGLTVVMSGFVSAYTMALIAFKRYYGIAFPFKEFTQNRKKLPFVFAVVLIWSLSIGSTLYFMKYVPIREYNDTLLLQQCTLLSYSFVALKDFPYFVLIGVVTIPLTFGLIFSLMTIVILQRRKIIGDHVDIARQLKERQDKFRSTLMIAVVILSFIIAWLPSALLTLKYVLNYSTMKLCDLDYNTYAIFFVLLMTSFWINPVIYWYMCPHFRRGITHIFSKRKTINNTNVPEHLSSGTCEI